MRCSRALVAAVWLAGVVLVAAGLRADEVDTHPPRITSGSLPTCTAGRDGLVYAWLVAASSTDCSAGGGTATALCQCDGTNWTSVRDGATGGVAASGDSATAFFSSGTIEHERGGLEADVSAYGGLVRIAAGSTSAVSDLAGLNTALGSSIADGAHTTDTNTTCLDAGVSCLFAASTSEGGPATTATALAANGANCSAGQWAAGVDASGVAEGCTADDTGTDDQTAAEVPYTPTTAGDWDDPDPTEVGGALDGLAAAIAAIVTTADDLSDNSWADLSDVTASGQVAGDVAYNASGTWTPTAGAVTVNLAGNPNRWTWTAGTANHTVRVVNTSPSHYAGFEIFTGGTDWSIFTSGSAGALANGLGFYDQAAYQFIIRSDRTYTAPEATAPATCIIGDHYVDSSGAYCACTSANTWTNTTGVGSCV